MTIINYYNNIKSLATGLSLAALLSPNTEQPLPLSLTLSLPLSLRCNNEYTLIISNKNTYYTVEAYKYTNVILNANYNINRDNIKIEYLYINNDYYANKFNEKLILTDYEYISLKEAIFNYIEMTAYKNGKTKLIIDIHNNMERYEYELKDIGFIKTDRRCLDNSFWYEAEKILKND